MKNNCWEFKNCAKMKCPTRTEEKLDGVHGGTNGGRACWVVSSTHCMGVQGACLDKKPYCETCLFYQKVRLQEGAQFTSPEELLKIFTYNELP